MREIKFRVWDILNNRMISFVDFPFELGDCTLQELFEIILEGLSERYVLMQYTGLKDNNGVEIYEGDILFHKTNYEPYICIVEWNNEDIASCGCCYDAFIGIGFIGKILPGSKYNYSKFSDCFDEMEIIGNIYENPELLEKGGN